jgi:hypothetical protein
MRPLRSAVLSATLAVVLLCPRAGVAEEAFNLVVNQHNATASLSVSDVKRLVAGGTKLWDGGVVVQLGIIPGDVPETQYLASLMDTSTRELLSLIQQQVFKGDLRRPVVLRSSLDCIAFATATPGALCVAARNVPASEGARVVPVR